MSHLCHGTAPAANWVDHPDQANQIYMQVDTSSCKFDRVPAYVCSLVGCKDHERTNGGSEIYHPTPTGFRVNVRWADVKAILGDGQFDYGELKAATARENKWEIHWVALPKPE